MAQYPFDLVRLLDLDAYPYGVYRCLDEDALVLVSRNCEGVQENLFRSTG